MPSIESILSKYDPSSSPEEPQSAEPSPKAAPSSIDSILSKYESSAPATQEKPQLHTPNPFVSTAKSTAASMANAFAGQPLEDIGETIGSETLQKAGKGVREFAEGVQKENPSQIGSLSDIVDKPLTAVETALGNVAPQIPVSLASGYAGAKLGGSLPLPLPAKAVAAGVGGILGAFAPNYLQEAAEMRGKQQESGVEDKTKAYLTAIPAAGLETASDVLLAGKFLPKAVKDTAIGKALTGLGEDTLSATGSRAAHVGKQALKGAGTEAGTEYAQTALEQLGGNQDLSTEEAQAEREVSAALGAIGGGAIGGGISAFDKRAGEVPPPATNEQAATQEPDFAEVPDTQPQEPIIAGAPSDLDSRTDEEKAAERQDRFNDLSARFYGTNDTDTVVDGKQVTIPGRPKEFLAPEEKAELAELEKEFGTPIDLSTPAAPAVDTKKTEDFLNRFENAWASTGKEPTRVTKALADEATKLGVPVTPNDSPMAVVAAMRAEIQARKTPEEVAQDVGDTIVAETLAAYPDGKPGIAGKTVIAGANSKVLEPQKLAAEQKLLEQQQPIVEEQVTELSDFEPEIPWEEYDDSIPGFEEPAPVVPLTPEELENMRIARDAAKYGIQEEEEADEDADRQAALQARYEANKAKQEAQDALKQRETGEVYGGGSQQLGLRGEGERPAISGEGVSPEGQTVGNIPSTEEKVELQLTGEANGESEDQAAQTTTQEVTEAPEEKARKLLVSAVPNGDLSALRGKENTNNRVKLIEALTGQPIAKDTATNARLVQEFYKAAGVDLNQTLDKRQKQFQAWASQAQELQEAGITEEYPIDLQAAKEAAASRFNGFRELPEDRDAQKKAYVSIKGVNIGIENPAGTKRRPEWPELKDHYGFFTGVKGKDGDYLDVFIKPGMTQADIDAIDTVYVVDQKNEDGSFDEHKVIIGPKTVEDAKTLYLENYEPGWQGLGAITEVPFDQFKDGMESYDPRLDGMDEPLAYVPPAVEEKPAEQTEEPPKTAEAPTEAAEEQVPETELTVQPEPAKGKPVADDFLKLMADFNRQQEKKYRLVDSDVKPTIGKGGRLHAPHNGYEWIDGNVYAGGQWLAESEDSIRGSRPSKATIEATPEVAAYLEEKAKDLDQIRVSLGKVYEKNGENRQYVYIEGGRALTRAITDLAPSRNKVLMAASDAEAKGLTLGKTWKYSYKRHFNEEMKYGTYLGSDESLDKQIVGYYYPDAVIRDIGGVEEGKAETPTVKPAEPIKAAIPEYKTEGGKNLTKAQERAQLVAEIDKAIAVAPKEQAVFAQDTDEIPQRLAEYKAYGTTEQRKHELTKEIHDLYSAQLDQITFKIPGGTRYKVLNTKPALEEFKKKVLASPGFKETKATTSKPKAPPFSVSSMIADFLKDNEYENAYYAAQEAGVRLGFGTSEKENTIPVYTDLEPVDLIPGRKMFVGRRFAKIEYRGNTEVKTYWHVIDEASGASISSGSSKKEALESAEKAIKERADIDGGKRLSELLEQAEARGASQEQLLDRFKKLHGIEDAPVVYKEPAVEESQTTVDEFIKSGDSLAELGTKLGLSEDEVDDVLIGKSWPRPSTPYLGLMNEIRGVIEDAKAKIKKPTTGSASTQKAYQATIQKWNTALDTLNAAEREFENPFSAKVAASRNYKELPPILKNRFEKRFDGITTGDQARREKYRAESAVKAEALIEFAKSKPKAEEPPIPFSRVETSEPLPELFESLGRVNKLSQLSDDQLQRIDEHPDAERIRYVQDNFLTLLSELDARPNSEFEIKC